MTFFLLLAARVSDFVNAGDDLLDRAQLSSAAKASFTPVHAVPSGVTPLALLPLPPTPL